MEGMPTHDKILGSIFQGVTPRTAGFNSLDYGQFHPTTLMGTDILMIIGGGSAGTAGGIKMTTCAVLVAAIIAEFRGEKSSVLWGRRLDHTVVRQALTVATLGISVVVVTIGAIQVFDPQFTSDRITFEVISAFATVGLTTGITPALSAPSQILLILVMYLGRIGPITLVTALALRNTQRRYELPTERPYIG